MFKIPKQEYTVEFKELAVKRVNSGQGVVAVAKDLGLVEATALRGQGCGFGLAVRESVSRTNAGGDARRP